MTKKTRQDLVSAILFLGLVVLLSLTPLLNTAVQAQGPDTPKRLGELLQKDCP